MFKILSEPLPSVYILSNPCFKDERGIFFKTFNQEQFSELEINFAPREQFSTISSKNVLRGMHFQTKEASHSKLVSCTCGSILDVIVDIRISSPNYNKPFSIQLSGTSNQMIFIGKGYAHGFLSLEDNTLVSYTTDKEYNPDLDAGVNWRSINFEWPVLNPLVSSRDQKHPGINEQQCEFF